MKDEEDIPADLSTLIRLGTISGVDLAAARCTVRFGNPDDDDGGAETPPIRWVAVRAGRTRKWSPPSEGEEVVLLCPDGQIGNAVALCGLPNDAFPAPGNTLAEFEEFEDGARVGYDPVAHALTAILPAGGTALIEAPAGVTIRGDVAIEGNVTLTGGMTATADIVAAGVSVSDHDHGGVQAGGANTLKPNPA